MKPRAQLLRMHPLCGVYIAHLMPEHLLWFKFAPSGVDVNLNFDTAMRCPITRAFTYISKRDYFAQKSTLWILKNISRENEYLLLELICSTFFTATCVRLILKNYSTLPPKSVQKESRERLEHAVPCIIKSHSSWCVLLFGEREKNGFFCLAANEAKRIPSSKTNEPSAAAFHAYRLWKLLFP